MIYVQQTKEEDPLGFIVTIRDDRSETRHRVTMARSTYLKLTGGKVSPDLCVQAAFKFLLDREPKESILSSFDVTLISKYFPNFQQEFAKYLPSP